MAITVASRFMTVKDYDPTQSGYLVLIFDYKWYAAHLAEIDTWLADSLPHSSRSGLVIKVQTEADASLFMIRWGSD